MQIITEIHAQEYVRKIPAGVTSPFILASANGAYVCKVGDSESSCRHLVNEFVCYHLAILLDIPIPHASLIRIDQSLIDSVEELKQREIRSTILFGSKLVEPALPKITPAQIERIINPDDIPSIILFDQIIYNNDRSQNDGNLLYDVKNKKILAIDHSHVFKDGLLWTDYSLQNINKDKKYIIDNFHGKYYKLLLPFVNGHNPFNKILKKMNTVKYEQIARIIDSVPIEWELNYNEAQELKQFIWHRLQNISLILISIQHQCPQWKGVVNK